MCLEVGSGSGDSSSSQSIPESNMNNTFTPGVVMQPFPGATGDASVTIQAPFDYRAAVATTTGFLRDTAYDANGRTSTVHLKLGGVAQVDSYQLFTATGADRRDPIAWTFGIVRGGVYQVLSSVTGASPPYARGAGYGANFFAINPPPPTPPMAPPTPPPSLPFPPFAPPAPPSPPFPPSLPPPPPSPSSSPAAAGERAGGAHA